VTTSSLDAADYDVPDRGSREVVSKQGARPRVSRAALASLPEGEPRFGYVLDDDGQLYVRPNQQRPVR
jgi:hypothetical protein